MNIPAKSIFTIFRANLNHHRAQSLNITRVQNSPVQTGSTNQQATFKTLNTPDNQTQKNSLAGEKSASPLSNASLKKYQAIDITTTSDSSNGASSNILKALGNYSTILTGNQDNSSDDKESINVLYESSINSQNDYPNSNPVHQYETPIDMLIQPDSSINNPSVSEQNTASKTAQATLPPIYINVNDALSSDNLTAENLPVTPDSRTENSIESEQTLLITKPLIFKSTPTLSRQDLEKIREQNESKKIDISKEREKSRNNVEGFPTVSFNSSLDSLLDESIKPDGIYEEISDENITTENRTTTTKNDNPDDDIETTQSLMEQGLMKTKLSTQQKEINETTRQDKIEREQIKQKTIKREGSNVTINFNSTEKGNENESET